MLFCDVCGRESDFLVLVCELQLCDDCLEPYDDLLSRCQSMREYDVVSRQIRADILGKIDKPP